MKRRHDNSSNKVRYQKLKTNTEDNFNPLQFKEPPPRVPYKAIVLACLLFLGGSILIIIGALLVTGHINVKYADRMYPLLILGGIMFVPGSYHVHLAYHAWKGTRGYSYDDIPEFD